MKMNIQSWNSLYCRLPQDHKLVFLIARVCNSRNLLQWNLCYLFIGDFAAAHIIGVSVIARFPPGKSWLYSPVCCGSKFLSSKNFETSLIFISPCLRIMVINIAQRKNKLVWKFLIQNENLNRNIYRPCRDEKRAFSKILFLWSWYRPYGRQTACLVQA